MTKTTYLDYDAETLYAEYNNRGKVADYEVMVADWARRSDTVRAKLPDAVVRHAGGGSVRPSTNYRWEKF